MALTIKKIYNLFKGITLAHPMLNEFRFGDPFVGNSRLDFKYPLLYLETPFVAQNDGFPNFKMAWEINFQILDKIRQDGENEADAEETANSLSQMEQIGQSVINYLQTLIGCEVYILPEFSVYTLFDENNSFETGVRYTITFISERSVTTCNELLLLGNICDYIKSC